MGSFLWFLVFLVGMVHARVPKPATISYAPRTSQTKLSSTPAPSPTTRAELDLSTAQGLKRRDILLPTISGTWTAISCSAPEVENELPKNMTERYLAAEVPDAWRDLMNGWNSYNPQDSNLGPGVTFIRYMSNAFHDTEGRTCEIGDRDCVSVSCEADGHAPATYLIADNMAFLSEYFSQVATGFQQAHDSMHSKMGTFVQTYAKIHDTSAITKTLLDIGLFLGLALIPTGFSALAAAEVVAASSVSGSLVTSSLVGSSVFIHNMAENFMKNAKTYTDETVQLDALVSTMVSSAMNQTKAFLDNMLAAERDTQQHLHDLIVYGTLHAFYLSVTTTPGQQSPEVDLPGELQTAAEKSLWAQLLVPTWKNAQAQFNPFILRVDRKDYTCKDPVANTRNGLNLEQYMNDNTKDQAIWCDKAGNSFFLLDAHITKEVCSSRVGCTGDTSGFKLLDGGNDKDLSAYSLSIEDIVLSTYGAYLLNGKKNGYIPSANSTQEVQADFSIKNDLLPMQGGVRVPGFFNLTVCVDANQAGENLDKNIRYKNGAPCQDPQDQSSVAPPDNSRGYSPGNCGIHVTQWRGKGDHQTTGNNNPLDKNQLGITITDDAGKALAYAPKQPLYGTLKVSSLLKDEVFVNTQSDKICFWYRDEYWCSDSTANRCHFGSYDGDATDTRDGDCIFHCSDPTNSTAPPAPSANLQRSPIQEAYKGQGGNKNIDIGGKGYRKGWCGLHTRVYQKNENADDVNPNPNYALELTVYDAGTKKSPPAVIGYQSQTFAAGGTVTVQGHLPYILMATAPANDSDPVQFKYAGANFQTGTGQCGDCSTYEHGYADCDCGFTC